MPMKKYLYHGQAFGVDADITDPGPYKLDHHAKCALTDGQPGNPTGSHTGFDMPGGLSHGACSTSIQADPIDDQGFIRTVVRSTVENLTVDGLSKLKIDSVNLGIISVYRKKWFDMPVPHAKRTRVLPLECSLVNPTLNGEPLDLTLPAPFHYSEEQRKAYLEADVPDPRIDAEVRQTIIDSPNRSIYIPHFGRIFFGEWTLLPNETWNPIHQIHMVRMVFSTPPAGGGAGGGGQGGGDSGGGTGG